MAAFLQNEEEIRLGDKKVKVKEVPLARLKKFQPLWKDSVERMSAIQQTVKEARDAGEEFTADSMFEEILNFALEIPYELLSVLIPGLPKEPFDYDGDDDTKGVTFPQIKRAFETVIEVNDMGWLKKQLPFFQNLMATISLESAPPTQS